MSTWCPKNSKLDGIPNISYESHKPVPLDTMFKNGFSCTMGVLVFRDIVQGPEKQQEKDYFGEQLFLISDNTLPPRTSEVLHQVKVSDIPDGGWVGGDAWFEGITTAIEVYKKLR